MDLVVEHLLVEVHRCLSSFFPTRFSGWPTSSSAGMMPPYEAQGELRRITLPRTPLNRPFRFASHGDDDSPLSVPFCQIPDGLWSLSERVGPVDHRRELAGFDELLKQDQVLAVLPCDESPQLLVHKPGQYRRPQLAIGASEPPSS